MSHVTFPLKKVEKTIDYTIAKFPRQACNLISVSVHKRLNASLAAGTADLKRCFHHIIKR